MRGIDLTISSLNDTKKRDYKIAILPWGATEPHNLHLPYLTDSILSTRISVEAAIKASERGVDAIVLPAVNMGAQNPGQREELGCIHSRYNTQYSILCDIVESLSYQGIKMLLIVNGHGGNNFKNMIRDLAADRPDFVIGAANWYTIIDGKDYFKESGEHADELESSVMMHYHPEYVDISTAGDGAASSFAIKSLREGKVWIPRNWKKVTADTGIGNPHKSTAEKGRIYSEAVTAKLSDIIVELATEELY